VEFESLMSDAAKGFEAVGVGVLVLGAVVATVLYLRALRADPRGAFDRLRNKLGRAILLGLEILIVADIIFTVTVAPTVTSAMVLGVIVLVRTFLSFSLEIELEGVLPWRRKDKTEL
jgi:uncharacterized membrane protein